MKRPICIHHHIFKNAGTTIDWTLKKNFGEDALLIDDPTDVNAVISTEQLLQYLTVNKNARSISSHQFHPFSVPDETEFRFLSIIFVRHPIDRAFSVYSFLKRHTGVDPITLKAHDLSLKQFINFSLEANTIPVMRNGQTRYIIASKSMSNLYKAMHRSADNLPHQSLLPQWAGKNIDTAYRAYYFLGRCSITGIVERIDESLVLAEERLRPFFPQIDFSYIKQNSSPDRGDVLNDRIEKARLEIGDELMNRLIESNHQDFQLYDYLSKKLDNEIKDIDNFIYKLANFKNRCLLLG